MRWKATRASNRKSSPIMITHNVRVVRNSKLKRLFDCHNGIEIMKAKVSKTY
jgi:hypothetical protein